MGQDGREDGNAEVPSAAVGLVPLPEGLHENRASSSSEDKEHGQPESPSTASTATIPSTPVVRQSARHRDATPKSWGEDGRDAGGTPTSRVGLVWDEIMLRHAPSALSNHFEQPGRVNQIRRTLLDDGLAQRCRRLPSRPATDGEVLRCHSAAHLAAVANGAAVGEGLWDAEAAKADPAYIVEAGDLYFNHHTAEAARFAAGCAAEAAVSVAKGEVDAALAVVRPPGHHATCSQAMGFCYFNSAAIAARAAVHEGGLERVVVLDWDVHHGNGTQDILFDDPRIMYISLHRYGHGFYPGTGNVDEVGAEGAEGRNVNVPWTDKGVGNGDYLSAFDWVLLPIVGAFKPQLVIIAAGFDAALGDPLGGCKVTSTGYAHLTARLVGAAEGGRVCAILEGGYSEVVTAECVAAVLNTLLITKAPEQAAREPKLMMPQFHNQPSVKVSTGDILRSVLEAQAPHWDVLRTDSFAREFEAYLLNACWERATTRSQAAGGPGAGFPNAPPLGRNRKKPTKAAKAHKHAPAFPSSDLAALTLDAPAETGES